MSFAVPVVADSVAARAGIGAAADGMGTKTAATASTPKTTPKRSARSSSTPISSGRKPTDSTAPRRRSPAERSVSVPAPTLSPPRGASGWSSADGAGFLLGLVAFALGTSYLRYGPAGVRGWFSAKFVNKVDPAIAAGEAARGITPKARPTGGAA